MEEAPTSMVGTKIVASAEQLSEVVVHPRHGAVLHRIPKVSPTSSKIFFAEKNAERFK